ncbi:hypothetical protein BU17DRAFT_89256 [Hysterangium stoloniferum]|nr:hypothetical protein BU17DRAFT_89256 [Hysterangium stoloniferum]
MSDKDSLFGSPPPSPEITGTYATLALPESSGWRMDAQSSSQNVGTIALPGSHNNFSELPVLIQPALPSEKPILQLRPPAQRVQVRTPNQTRYSTPRPTTYRPSSYQPSPVPHSERTDRTLRDLVGLISHFEPTAGASIPSRPAPIPVPTPQTELHPPGSQQNPIEIDAPGPADAVNSALIALASTVASALKLPTAPRSGSSLSEPTVNNVLHCIKHDPKLIPTLQATYEYLGSIPKGAQQQQYSASFDDATAKRKRKRKYPGPKVPAGAEHWDVPFPFAPEQESNDYPSQWQLERGRRVLGELLGLFERGFAKVRGEEVPLKNSSTGRVLKRKRTTAESTDTGFERILRTPSSRSESNGLDVQRMTDWLSSVPASSDSSGIIDSTNVTPTQPSSTFEPSSSASLPNTLFDFMAMLDSHAGNEVDMGGKTDDLGTYGVEDKTDDFGYSETFDNLDFSMGDDIAWQSLLDSLPTPQASTPALSSDILLQEPSMSAPIPDELIIDPTPMTVSQPQSSPPALAVPQMTAATVTPLPSIQNDDRGPVPRLPSLTIQRETGKEHAGTELDFSDSMYPTFPHIHKYVTQELTSAQSAGAQSLHTAPTGIESQSLRTASPVLSIGGPSSTPRPTQKMQRRDVVLAMAREHRDHLVRELERVKIARWELLIEGGVIRNLETATNVP